MHDSEWMIICLSVSRGDFGVNELKIQYCCTLKKRYLSIANGIQSAAATLAWKH